MRRRAVAASVRWARRQPPYAAVVAVVAAAVGFGCWAVARPRAQTVVVREAATPAPKPASRRLPTPSAVPAHRVHHARPKPRPPTTPAAGGGGSADVAAMVGQKLMLAVTAAPSADLLARIRAGQVGGIIIMGQHTPADAAEISRSLQEAARQGHQPGLLIATDQEGGEVKRITGPPNNAPATDGRLGDSAARADGQAAGQVLRSAGINVDLAPVADVVTGGSFLGTRSFGSDPQTVASRVVNFFGGLSSAGVAATAKHFPGLGSTGMANTDTQVVHTGAVTDRQLLPFKSLVQASVPLVMVSNASYGGSDVPAVLSSDMVNGLLRGRLGFTGVVISDSLAAKAVAGLPDVPGHATNAGTDILLYSDAPTTPYDQLLHDVQSGTVSRAALAASYQRIMALKQRLGLSTTANGAAGAVPNLSSSGSVGPSHTAKPDYSSSGADD